MIYTGEFISKNKINYQVQFITASGNTNKEIILSEQPVTISFESEDDIFKPLKLSGATVRCWVKDYMFDLYSGEAKGVKCIVTNKEDNSVIWCGYVTPNLYSQDYLQHKFELEVECIDALAVLQYIKYNVTDRQVRSFKDIIDDAIQKTGYDLNLNVVDFCNYKLEDMYISDSNFFDEDGEPMTYKEVLENILQYLNLTMLLYADTIYILDYNLIKNDEDAIKLDESIIYSTPTLSLTEVFNKITVNSSLYPIKLSPDCFNEDFIIESGEMQMYTAKSNGVYGRTVFRKYTYSKDDVILKGAELSDKYWQSDQKKGTAFITGYTVVQDKNGKYKILPKSEWDTVIVAETEGNPPFEWFTVKDNKGVILPANGVININGQFQNSRYNYPTSSSDLESVYKSYIVGSNWFQEVIIKIGDLYYNSMLNKWQETFVKSRIYHNDTATDDNFNSWMGIRTSEGFEETFPGLKGMIIPLPPNGSSGDLEFTFFTLPQLTIKDEKWSKWSLCKELKIDIVSKEYSEGETETKTIADLKSSDTVYTTTINEDNVSEFDDIDLKVATDTSKGISLSAVAYKENDQFKFINNITKIHNNESGLFEHHLLDAYHKQYSKPNIKLDLTLKGLIAPNTKIVDIYNNNLIINKAEYDLADNTSSLTLIEKK